MLASPLLLFCRKVYPTQHQHPPLNTGVMWHGIALMVISGTVGIVRKRRQRTAK